MTMTGLIGTELSATCREARELVVADDATAKAADLVIAKLKAGERDLEHEKEQRCRPILSELDATRSPYLKAIDFLKSVRKQMDNRLGAYRASLEHARQLEQQRLLETHQRRQQDLEAKAEEARLAAEAAKAAGDAGALAKAEAKAEKLALKAASLPGPTVLPSANGLTVLDDGSTQSQRAIKKAALPGHDLTKKVSAADAAFDGFDFSSWRHLFVVDMAAVNAELKSRGALPAPFAVVTEYSSTLRKG